jgi:hypothetical protein
MDSIFTNKITKVGDDDSLIQILCFLILSIVLFLFKTQHRDRD